MAGEKSSAACAGHEDKLLVFALAARIVDQHLSLLQKRDLREMTKVLGTPAGIDPARHRLHSQSRSPSRAAI